MKKLIWSTIGYFVFLGVLSVANNVVLLNLHDFAYYYTLDGIKLAGIVCGIEAALIVPLSKLYFQKILKEDFEKIFGETEKES